MVAGIPTQHQGFSPSLPAEGEPFLSKLFRYL